MRASSMPLPFLSVPMQCTSGRDTRPRSHFLGSVRVSIPPDQCPARLRRGAQRTSRKIRMPDTISQASHNRARSATPVLGLLPALPESDVGPELVPPPGLVSSTVRVNVGSAPPLISKIKAWVPFPSVAR